jgi:hypothetical protein
MNDLLKVLKERFKDGIEHIHQIFDDGHSSTILILFSLLKKLLKSNYEQNTCVTQKNT